MYKMRCLKEKLIFDMLEREIYFIKSMELRLYKHKNLMWKFNSRWNEQIPEIDDDQNVIIL